MVKHTQRIRREIADELFECVCKLIGSIKVGSKGNKTYVLSWALKIVLLPSPDQPDSGGIDTKYFI